MFLSDMYVHNHCFFFTLLICFLILAKRFNDEFHYLKELIKLSEPVDQFF